MRNSTRGRDQPTAGGSRGSGDGRPPIPPATKTIGGTDQPGRRRRPACRSSGLRQERTRGFRLDAIICDVDQVLLLFDPTVAEGIEQRHQLRAGSLLDTLLDLPTAKLASIGVISNPQWLRYARETLPPPAVDDWLGYHGSVNQPVVDLLISATLAGVRLFFLANSTDRLRDDLAHHHLGDLAEQTYSSSEIGYAKPDPRSYEHVIRDASLNPRRTLYVDDNPSWVATGTELGMRGHWYTDAAQLRQELLRAGVVV